MDKSFQAYRYLPSFALLAVIASVAAADLTEQAQTFAPHELRASVAPPAIVWPTPLMPAGPIEFQSAEQRHLRLVVMTKSLQQPWSMAFLPDGSMLVTERPGRLRIMRDGVLDPNPVRGVPTVKTGGEGGLQG